MVRSRVVRWGVLLALGGLGGVAHANVMIDFETRPNGGLPVDDAVLHAPYAIDGGGTVRFFFDRPDRNGTYNNTFDPGHDVLPVFEQVGTDGEDGFVASRAGAGVHDRAPMGSGFNPQLGTFFLRQPDAIGGVPGPFIIAYDTAQVIREFSGEIWDIDAAPNAGFEQWKVDVLNASGDVLATRISPRGEGLLGTGPGSLDSLPWLFGFHNLPDGVATIRISFSRHPNAKKDGIGLAFNNFSPTFAVPNSVAAPEPSSLALLGTAALLGLSHAIRRRRR